MKQHADDLQDLLTSQIDPYYKPNKTLHKDPRHNSKQWDPERFFNAYTGFLTTHIRTMQLQSLTNVVKQEDEHMWLRLDDAELKDKRVVVAKNDTAIAATEDIIKALDGDAS